MLAEVIELYPLELTEMVEETITKWNDGQITRAKLNEEITFLLMLFGRKQLRVPERSLRVAIKNDGYLLYDSDSLSEDSSSCPVCGKHFFEGSKTMYIHQGIQQHDKYVYACSCGVFYSMYYPRDEIE